VDKSINWIITGMLPSGHKGMIASAEGGCKTTLLSWVAICITLGYPLFDMPVKQGKVLMIDEETPYDSLKRKLDRFALSFKLKGIQDIPNLTLLSKGGFRFSRKNKEIIDVVKEQAPTLITIDTVLACLPSGRQGLEENNSNTGIAIRDDLDTLLQASLGSAILIAAHSGKSTSNYEIEDYRKAEMRTLVRGHGSITGEACDTGYGLLKITENPILRFALIPKPRREAISMVETYIEMKEQTYGEGWAKLEKIEPVPTPPSRPAIDLSSIFLSSEKNELEAKDIRQKASALYTPGEIRLGLDQLRRRKVIVTTKDSFTFKLNPKVEEEADSQYINQLLSPQNV